MHLFKPDLADLSKVLKHGGRRNGAGRSATSV